MMEDYSFKVKQFLLDMGLTIEKEDSSEELFIVSDPENGIQNLVIDCEYPVLIIEQLIAKLPEAAKNNPNTLKSFLQMNRKLVHGAFSLDDTGEHIIFRDTLQLKNLDLNELEGSINALSLGLAEHGEHIIAAVEAH
ncbi:MAG: molecular chaperone Tir [Oligoflexales bacterium]